MSSRDGRKAYLQVTTSETRLSNLRSMADSYGRSQSTVTNFALDVLNDLTTIQLAGGDLYYHLPDGTVKTYSLPLETEELSATQLELEKEAQKAQDAFRKARSSNGKEK